MRNQRTHILPRLVLAGLALLTMLLLSAPSALASEGCPNEAVRAESNINPTTHEPYDLALPECRAYEMVSPLDKQDLDAFNVGFKAQIPVSPDGSAVGWGSQGNYANPENYEIAGLNGPENPYIAHRTSSGWATRSAYAPTTLVEKPSFVDANPPYLVLSSDLSAEAACGLASPAKDTCALSTTDGSWLSSSSYGSVSGADLKAPDVLGASANLSEEVFKTPAGERLLPADESTFLCDIYRDCGALYELSGLGIGASTLSLVDVDNNGRLIGPDSPVGLGATFEASGGSTSYQAISATGATIYFTATPTESNGFGSSTGVQTIFARLNSDSTVDVSNPAPSQCNRSASEPGGECDAPAAALYQGASQDGMKVYFTTEQQLVNNDRDSTNDLYEYDFSMPAGQRVVQVSGGGTGDPTPGTGARVGGVVSISEDGSHVYFTAEGVLTTVPNAADQIPTAGKQNLYAFNSESNETRFVATLSSLDVGLTGARTGSRGSGGSLENRLAQTTPDGGYLIFDSFARLITAGPEASANSAEQVYRYDFQTGVLTRVSISHNEFGENGDTPGINSLIGPKKLGQFSNEGGNSALPDINDTNRAISDNGSDVVFLSAQQLDGSTAGGPTESCVAGTAPGTSGLAGCQAYEWHECADGMCENGEHGEVNQISNEQEPGDIDFVVISATGSDIFFQSRAQLVGQDTDELGDIYDARIDGGFPASTPEPSCSGEACQGTQSSSPTFGTPGSQTFTGGGNQTALPFKEVLEPETKPKSKPLTRVQTLTRALMVCRRERLRKKRVNCERSARKRYRGGKKPNARR